MDSGSEFARVSSQMLAGIARAAAEHGNRSHFLKGALAAIHEGIPFEFAEMVVPAPEGDALLMEYGFNWGKEDTEEIVISDFDRGPHGDALLSHRPILVWDLTGPDAPQLPEFYAPYSLRSALVVPLPPVSGAVRLLGLYSRKQDAFDEDAMHLAIAASGALALALLRLETIEERDRQFELASEPCYRVDAQGKYLGVNRAFAQLAGYPTPEAFLHDFARLTDGLYVSKDSPHRILAHFSQNEWTHSVESRIRNSSGQALWVRETGVEVPNPNGGPKVWEMRVEDITVQQRETLAGVESLQRSRGYAEALIRCGSLLRGTVSRSLQGICQVVASSLVVERVSIWMQSQEDGALELLASHRNPDSTSSPTLAPSMEQGRLWLGALDDHLQKAGEQTDVQALWQARMVEIPPSNEDEHGSKMIVGIFLRERLVGLLSVEAIGRRRVWNREDSAFLAAISTQLSLVIEGQRLRLAESRYRMLAENATDLISRHTMRGEYMYITPSCRAILGYEPEQMIGRSMFDFMHPEDRVSIESSLSTILGSPSTTLMDYRIRHTDGSYVWVESTSRLVRDPMTDSIEEFLVCSRDVTERRRAEMAMRESEENFRFIFESSLDVIMIMDAKTASIRRINRPVSRALLYEPNSLVGRPFATLLPPGSELRAADFPKMLSDFLSHQEATGVVFESQPIMRADGTVCAMDLAVTEIPWENERAILMTLRDVTERNIIEEERQKMSKLESVGLLAGGIAHDFNNLLMAIKGNIEMAGLELEGDHAAMECLTDANSACQRAEGLARQLLTFAKGGEPIKKRAEMARLLRETAGFSLRGSKAVAKFEIPEDIWHVEMDEGQISQTINNLIINADQAMPTGGTIRISCENVRLDGDSIDLPAGLYVRVAIKDEGIGIPRELLSKIFDPYYTTKPKGSGLGLATCYSIVKKHGGHLRADSEAGKGALFEFFLPAHDVTMEQQMALVAEQAPVTSAVAAHS